MNQIAARRLGTTALKVSALGFGAAPIGGFRATITEAEAQALLEAAWQGGVRFFDTSPFYGYGRSELRLGHFLRQRAREEFIISTKIGRDSFQHSTIAMMASCVRLNNHACALGFRAWISCLSMT